MSLPILDESLSSMDAKPGLVVSTDVCTRALCHETSTGAMILRGIHATTAEAFSTLGNLEDLSPPVTGAEGASPKDERDFMLHVNQLRSQFGDISQMVCNMEERLASSTFRLILAGDSGGSQESLISNVIPPALEHGVINMGTPTFMDVESPTCSSISTIDDLSSLNGSEEVITWNRRKRSISQVDEAAQVESPPKKRRTQTKDQSVHRLSQCRRSVNRALRMITGSLSWFW